MEMMPIQRLVEPKQADQAGQPGRPGRQARQTVDIDVDVVLRVMYIVCNINGTQPNSDGKRIVVPLSLRVEPRIAFRDSALVVVSKFLRVFVSACLPAVLIPLSGSGKNVPVLRP